MGSFLNRKGEFPLRRSQRSKKVVNVRTSRKVEGGPQGIHEALDRDLSGIALSNPPLDGGAKHHDLSAYVSTEIHKGGNVVSGALTDCTIGIGDRQPFWRDEKPVQPYDFEPQILRNRADFSPFRRVDLPDVFRKCKRCDLDTVVADLRDESAGR